MIRQAVMSTRWIAAVVLCSSVLCAASAGHAQSSPLWRASLTAPMVTVPLTRDGVFESPDAALSSGLSIVDRQSTDLDGDGDADVLAFVDVSETSSAYGTNAGRGAVVFFCEGQRAWRGRTVASVPAVPFESAYNWGDVSHQRRGSAGTVVRLLYSAAHQGRFAHAEFRLRFDREGIHVLNGAPRTAARRSGRRVNVLASRSTRS